MRTLNYAVSPGEYLVEWIADHGITDDDLIALGFDESDVFSFYYGRIKVNDDLAGRLEDVTGIPASAWIKYETEYRKGIAEGKIHNRDLDGPVQVNGRTVDLRNFLKGTIIDDVTGARWESSMSWNECNAKISPGDGSPSIVFNMNAVGRDLIISMVSGSAGTVELFFRLSGKLIPKFVGAMNLLASNRRAVFRGFHNRAMTVNPVLSGTYIDRYAEEEDQGISVTTYGSPSNGVNWRFSFVDDGSIMVRTANMGSNGFTVIPSAFVPVLVKWLDFMLR